MLDNILEFLKTQDIKGLNQVLYSVDGVILYANNIAQSLYLNGTHNICGKTLFDIAADGYLSIDKATNLDNIRKNVIINKQLARYIDVTECSSCNYDGFEQCDCDIFQANVLEANHYPLLDDEGKVLATLEQSSKHNRLGISDFLKLTDGDICRDTEAAHLAQIKFTNRELQILYLLLNNLSQRDVAAFMGVSRGTISKAITIQLSKKLGVESGDQEGIIKKATDLGIDRIIPRSLVKKSLLPLNW